MKRPFVAGIGALAGMAAAASAQTGVVPVRPIGRLMSVSKDSLKGSPKVRVLSDGRVLVSDFLARHILIFDPTLGSSKAVADTLPGSHADAAFGGGAFAAWGGDTSLFLDQQSLSAVVITPAGKIGRVMALPRPMDVGWMINSGVLATSDGALIYHLIYPLRLPPNPKDLPKVIPDPDSIPLLRANLATRKVDTAGWLRSLPHGEIEVNGPGGVGAWWIENPFRGGDVWAMLHDGTLAIVRYSDFHVDFIHADGRVTSSPKVEHSWVRLTDSAKAAIMDSDMAPDPRDKASPPINVVVNAAFLKAQAAAVVDSRPAAEESRAAPGPKPPRIDYYTDPSDLPDYAPPFTSQLVLVDVDDNMWIPMNPVRKDGTIYDVVSSKGVLMDRVQIPGGTTLCGFGPGVAYLSSREGTFFRLGRFSIR